LLCRLGISLCLCRMWNGGIFLGVIGSRKAGEEVAVEVLLEQIGEGCWREDSVLILSYRPRS
jgi:hypothetical protein